jgi:hypothetical protein
MTTRFTPIARSLLSAALVTVAVAALFTPTARSRPTASRSSPSSSSAQAAAG